MARPRDELGGRESPRLELGRERGPDRRVHRHRSLLRLQLDAQHSGEAFERLGDRRADVERERDAARDDVDRARLHVEHPDRRHRRRRSQARRRARAARTPRPGRARHRVPPSASCRRAPHAREGERPARVAGHRRDDRRAERRVVEPPALLDVQLDEPTGQRVARRDEGVAPLAAGLLGAEHNDAERSPLRCRRATTASSPPTTPSAPSNLPPCGHRVQVRPCPHLRQLGLAAAQTAEEVAGCVALDLEPGLRHPAGGELERLVLLGLSPGRFAPGPPPIA